MVRLREEKAGPVTWVGGALENRGRGGAWEKVGGMCRERKPRGRTERRSFVG